MVKASLLLPAGLIAGSSVIAGCGVMTGGDSGMSEDPDKLVKEALANEIALIQSLGTANYAGNKELAGQIKQLIAVHTEHALALDPDAVIGQVPTANSKLSPEAALARVQSAQRSNTQKQKALALKAADEDLAFKLAIISASEAQCSAHAARIKA